MCYILEKAGNAELEDRQKGVPLGHPVGVTHGAPTSPRPCYNNTGSKVINSGIL